MSTKRIIGEQILYKLAGSIPDTAFPIQEEDVWKALDQKINSLFKLKHFEVTLSNGETMPENAMIATYENVAVTSFGEKSKATLPITPISMPKNMGIYLVYNPAYPDNPFIPIQRGQRFLLNADSLLNELSGQISYEPRNTDIIFSKDITIFGVSAVTMELCVFEMGLYGVNDDLPIPRDYESTLVDELVASFSPVTAEPGTVNNWATNEQNIIRK